MRSLLLNSNVQITNVHNIRVVSSWPQRKESALQSEVETGNVGLSPLSIKVFCVWFGQRVALFECMPGRRQGAPNADGW